jgi:hypothetical protein
MVFLDPSRADFVLDRTRAFFRGPRAPRPALARLLAFAGPTFIASVAYLDPGNFATNITAGATHGHQQSRSGSAGWQQCRRRSLSPPG